jgi:hypothetical protein
MAIVGNMGKKPAGMNTANRTRMGGGAPTTRPGMGTPPPSMGRTKPAGGKQLKRGGGTPPPPAMGRTKNTGGSMPRLKMK